MSCLRLNTGLIALLEWDAIDGSGPTSVSQGANASQNRSYGETHSSSAGFYPLWRLQGVDANSLKSSVPVSTAGTPHQGWLLWLSCYGIALQWTGHGREHWLFNKPIETIGVRFSHLEPMRNACPQQIKIPKNTILKSTHWSQIRRIFGLAMRPTWAMRNQWVQGKKKQA